MAYRIDISVVRQVAKGQWDRIFSRLAPALKQAQEHAGKHIPCPVHGGKDAFRLFPDYSVNGACICNTCGSFRDGFATLSWVNGWTFWESLEAVASELGLIAKGVSQQVPKQLTSDIWRGVILYVGHHDIASGSSSDFVLRLYDEISTSQVTLKGADLERVCKQRSVKISQRIEIRRVTKENFRRSNEYPSGRCAWQISIAKDKRNWQKDKADERYHRYIERLWQSACPVRLHSAIQEPLVLYLKHRGLLALIDEERLVNIRFNRFCRIPESEQTFPGMIAAVRDIAGRLINVHSTLLTEDGFKAALEVPKRLCKQPSDSTISGCTIHFGEPKKVLALAEGIETALSVVVGTGLPCWSCISANGLISVQIPPEVEHVYIYADKDRSGVGQEAAEKLRERLLSDGIHVDIVSVPYAIPMNTKGIDWNDVLVNFGQSGFTKSFG